MAQYGCNRQHTPVLCVGGSPSILLLLISSHSSLPSDPVRLTLLHHLLFLSPSFSRASSHPTSLTHRFTVTWRTTYQDPWIDTVVKEAENFKIVEGEVKVLFRFIFFVAFFRFVSYFRKCISLRTFPSRHTITYPFPHPTTPLADTFALQVPYRLSTRDPKMPFSQPIEYFTVTHISDTLAPKHNPHNTDYEGYGVATLIPPPEPVPAFRPAVNMALVGSDESDEEDGLYSNSSDGIEVDVVLTGEVSCLSSFYLVRPCILILPHHLSLTLSTAPARRQMVPAFRSYT